ncbi:LytTR family two component transcriptional regulator [Breznakibacter xylanolyticus]|uniref:LytTR family two component transcriptional regulator n=2 Tax=Breznakibacter xylanolyticus TaxID=990 RepID=A0A2W7QEN0_9BACT|nr:LytTR family two component transcriptional regulator [Breznakibacter xylanolyticus]
MKMKCIVVDDEFPARALLQDYISKFPDLELVGSFASPVSALSAIQTGGCDVLFLDIQMPDISGVDFLKSLTRKPLVVFTTAYQEYAIEGYQLDVLDYLLKPFSFERFVQTINKVNDRMLKEAAASASVVAGGDSGTDLDQFIAIKADHKVHRIRYENIVYIEGLREYVSFFCKNEKIITLESLRNLENTLPQNRFIRVHKSYIVNSQHVKSLYGNMLILEGVKEPIPIGKSYRDAVQAHLFEGQK